MKYFSVKRSIKIGGKLYKPCVCYETSDSLMFTVKSLADSGIAVLHEDEVFFQNGAMLDKKAMESRAKEKAKAKREAKKKTNPTHEDLRAAIEEPVIVPEG